MAIFPFHPHAVALFQYLQPSTQCTWPLDLSPQSITLRRATLGKNTGVVTFVSATTAETESAHVRRTLLTAVGFGGDTSLLSCTFCASARDSMAKFDRFPLFSASPDCLWKVFSESWPKTAEIDQGVEGQRAGNVGYTSTRPSEHCRTESSAIGAGLKCAGEREAKLQAISKPPPKASLCSSITVVSDRLRRVLPPP